MGLIYNGWMKTDESIQCQSCGASSGATHPDKPILECEHCGSVMSYIPDADAQEQKIKPARLTFLLIMLPVVVVVLMVVFWVVFQNIREQTQITRPVSELSLPASTGPFKANNAFPVIVNNKSGEPVGMGLAFAAEKELMLNDNSGFKIQVGIFLVEKTAS